MCIGSKIENHFEESGGFFSTLNLKKSNIGIIGITSDSVRSGIPIAECEKQLPFCERPSRKLAIKKRVAKEGSVI